MTKKNKLIILISGVIGILILVIGISYAVYSFSRTGENNSEVILGDIRMKYTESSKSINIQDMIPSKDYANNYFEFTIDGKNTYTKKDIYYEIVLNHGDEVEGKTTRIDDIFLKIKLVEVVGEEEKIIFTDRIYSDLNNKRIWVQTIRNEDGNFNKIYRLYVRIDENTNICGGVATDNCDYYINPSEENANRDWNKLYASIKVDVKGDLKEKTFLTDQDCYKYNLEYDGEVYGGTRDLTLTLNDLTNDQEKLQICVDYLSNFIGYEPGTDEYNQLNAMLPPLCMGQTVMGLDFNSMALVAESIGATIDYDYLEQEGIIRNYRRKEGYRYFNGSIFQELQINNIDKDQANITITSYDVDACGANVIIPSKIDDIKVTTIDSSAFQDNQIKNLSFEENSNLTTIGYAAFSGNQIESVEIPSSVTTIESYAFDNSGIKNLTFEENSSLTTMGWFAFNGNQIDSANIPSSLTEIGRSAFQDNGIKNLTFEENSNLTTISYDAFYNNQLTSVEIPNSVTTIGSSAFRDNQIKNLTFEENSNLTTIGNYAFSGNQIGSVIIPNSVLV